MSRASLVRSRRRALRAGTPRDRLLAAATEIFTLRGYAGTSVREIVERAGVTKPVLYYHFGNKEGIYRALSEQIVADFEARLTEARGDPGNALDRVTAVACVLFTLARERIETVRFFYGIFYGPLKSSPPFDFQVFSRRLRQTLTALLEQGADARELRRDAIADLRIGIEALLNFAIESSLVEPERNFATADLSRLIALLFAGAAGVQASPAQLRSSRISHKEIHS